MVYLGGSGSESLRNVQLRCRLGLWLSADWLGLEDLIPGWLAFAMLGVAGALPTGSSAGLLEGLHNTPGFPQGERYKRVRWKLQCL